MVRTTIMLPGELQTRAVQEAQKLGVSLAALVRECLEARLTRSVQRDSRDPLFRDEEVYDGPSPSDLAADHDRYLYGD
jgi:hypothetical protein